ncbi:MAG: antitoxin HigA [Thermomicrobiales bacterium]|jgi:addiction module HigA family antidote|nr:antitoxin HigA [Thermomicrobiales bacterium]
MRLPGNRFEALRGDRAGQYSIRINDQWRICFERPDGEILADELAELQISAAQLSRELHVPTNRITQILAGKRAITADTALRLGRWFGTGPELWLNLQKAYELHRAEQPK